MSMAAAASANGRRKRRRAMADINVTPLVDVMLVLLVIFMITAPVLKDAIDVDLPRVPGTGAGRAMTPFVIVIDGEGRVHVGGRMLQPAEVGTELPKLLRGHENETVTLKAHRRLPYDSVVKVLATVRAVGITGITIAVERE
ncbi:MAG: biopolymer transporter ExbD [Planctomycetota bacterium]|nr:biopolymer transporter ExbD [Planctomycetota bacterium]